MARNVVTADVSTFFDRGILTTGVSAVYSWSARIARGLVGKYDEGSAPVTYIEEIRALVGTRPLILVGAVVIISDDEGRVLLEQRKFPYGQWGLPGGLMELGESAEDAARREVLEETSLVVGSLVLEGVYSGPDHFITAANGDQIQSVTIAYSSCEISGELQVNPEESLAFEYVRAQDRYGEIRGNYRVIIKDYLQSRGQ